MKQWQQKSAFFNGEAVEVEHHVSPDDKGVFFEIGEVMVGERVGAGARAGEPPRQALQPDTEAICGGSDDRVASSDPAVGRIVPAGCTGWIISNGAYLTAGHCADQLETLEFNVPASDDDGTINHPALKDEYPINQRNVDFRNDGVGNDWAVFEVNPTDTGLRPVHAQKAFYRMSRDSDPETFRITGHGVDGPPDCFGSSRQPGCTPPRPPTSLRNADSQTQQTHTGRNRGESGGGAQVTFRYEVDTQGGNSGSPIIVEGTAVAPVGGSCMACRSSPTIPTARFDIVGSIAGAPQPLAPVRLRARYAVSPAQTPLRVFAAFRGEGTARDLSSSISFCTDWFCRLLGQQLHRSDSTG